MSEGAVFHNQLIRTDPSQLSCLHVRRKKHILVGSVLRKTVTTYPAECVMNAMTWQHPLIMHHGTRARPIITKMLLLQFSAGSPASGHGKETLHRAERAAGQKTNIKSML